MIDPISKISAIWIEISVCYNRNLDPDCDGRIISGPWPLSSFLGRIYAPNMHKSTLHTCYPFQYSRLNIQLFKRIISTILYKKQIGYFDI